MKKLRVVAPTGKKEMRKPDAPRPGYKRWSTQVRVELLKDFYQVAENEDKVLIDAVEEALSHWTYLETDHD